jgi:hypothetical protein
VTRLFVEIILAIIGLVFCVGEFILGFVYAFTFNNNEKSF